MRPPQYLICLAAVIFIAFAVDFPLVRVRSAADPCSIPNFDVPAKINTTSPRAVVVDDFNKDGKADIAVANNRSAGTIAILLGNGNGGFINSTFAVTGNSPAFIASGDLNGDGNPDLVSANQSNTNGELSVSLGNGSGGFSSPTPIHLFLGQQNRMTSVAVGDVNGDSKPDLMATSSTSNGVAVLFGNGNGTFTFFKNFPAGGVVPNFIVFRDFNSDGKGDLVIANQANFSGAGNVAISLGDGAGNFAAPATVATASNATSLAVADFNGDAKLDIAASTGSNVTVLLGDGAGHFGAPANFGNIGIYSLVAAEFNGDGKLDLAALTGASVVVFLGDGSGAFTPVANFLGAGPTSSLDVENLAVADFNGDTRPDLAAGFQSQGALSLFINACGTPPGSQLALGPGSFSAAEDFTPASAGVFRTGDITGTASFQFESANDTAVAPQDYTAVSGSMTLAPGEIGKGMTIPIVDDNITEVTESFRLSIFNVTGATLGSPSSTAIPIFDNDATPVMSINDLSFNEGNNGTTNAIFKVTLDHPSSLPITVNYATADGAATAGSDYQSASGTLTFNPGEVTKDLSVIINGDTLSEVNETFFANLSNVANATLGDAQGLATILDDDASCPSPSFGSAIDFGVSSNPFDLVTADFNRDGKKDLAVANRGSSTVSILLGNGAGGFTIPAPIAVGNSPTQIVAVDVNLDNKVDLITANSNFSADIYSISVLLGDGNGGFSVNTTTPVSPITGLSAADFNSDNKPDLAILGATGANKISVLFGNGAGGFGSPTDYSVGTSPLFVTSGDLNGDGKSDLAVANLNSNNVSILLNTGNGVFSAATNFAAGSGPVAVAIGDLNGDGKADLAVPNNIASTSILLGNGVGGFSQPTILKFGARPFRAAIADLNGDGRRDVVVGDIATGSAPDFGGIWVLFGNGSGAFTTPVKYSIGANPGSVLAADFNSDGKLDLAAVVTLASKTTLLLNTCPGNSIDQATFLVRQHYLDFLNREPDQSGWDFWTSQIASCGGEPQCTEVRRIDVSASFFLSIEFQNNGYLVERFHKVAYGDAIGNSIFGGAHQLAAPVVRFNEFLQGTQRIGQGVIVLQPGWEQALETNKQAYALEFVQTTRFVTAFSTTMTPTQFVDKLNQNAGNVLSATERTSAINLFGSAADSSNGTNRAQAVRIVAEDQDLYTAEYNRAFVLAEYFGYLRRNPNDAPESTLDYTGYDFWLTKLNQFNGNYIQAEMVRAFLSSIEYRQRFGT